MSPVSRELLGLLSTVDAEVEAEGMSKKGNAPSLSRCHSLGKSDMSGSCSCIKLRLIVTNVPRILVPPALAFSVIKLCDFLFDWYTPHWLYTSLSLASLPFVLACSLLYTDLRDRRQAAFHGAFLAPSVPSKWPGGLDLLISSLRNASGGYMGMCHTTQVRWFAHHSTGEVLEQRCKANGNTITLNILWEKKASGS
jgi:hypothetical protein